jgi:hypothetical protein
MNRTAIDHGHAQITAFSNAADEGEIRYTPDVACRAAVEGPEDDQRVPGNPKSTADGNRTPGVGAFRFALDLQSGFGRTAADGLTILDQLVQGAMQLQYPHHLRCTRFNRRHRGDTGTFARVLRPAATVSAPASRLPGVHPAVQEAPTYSVAAETERSLWQSKCLSQNRYQFNSVFAIQLN